MSDETPKADSAAMYVTTYCNHAHRVSDGKPIEHNCYILPPAAIAAEMAHNFPEAIRLIEAAKPLREMVRGIKAPSK